MSAPLSLRLDDDALQRLHYCARVERMPPRTLAQRMIDEGLRMAAHREIRFTNGPTGRRATLCGCGLDVWQVIDVVRANGDDPAKAADHLSIPLHWVEACIAYYGAYADEIDEWIELERLEEERGLAEYQAGMARLTG